MKIPHAIRGCAKDAYHFWLRTGKTEWSYGSTQCTVQDGSVLVVEGMRSWVVPICKTWS